jgi:hypothetical protein
MEMPVVRLIREVTRPGGSGPSNGQFALQKALYVRSPGWLKLGGTLRGGEIPWFWCWEDREAAAAHAAAGQPLILGPNVLFGHSRRPCAVPAERELCHAASCGLIFTESRWYRDLIEEHRGPNNRARIVLWPYPIDPRPGGPLSAQYDLLIYAKSGYTADLIAGLRTAYRRSVTIPYGAYGRAELCALARRCRACAYLSDDDRGPLALAEILLCGCPAIGIPRGAPFIRHGHTGIVLSGFRLAACLEGIRRCHQLDRYLVAAKAAGQFDTARIVSTVLAALRTAVLAAK